MLRWVKLPFSKPGMRIVDKNCERSLSSKYRMI
jgi:hypothetical protein